MTDNKAWFKPCAACKGKITKTRLMRDEDLCSACEGALRRNVAEVRSALRGRDRAYVTITSWEYSVVRKGATCTALFRAGEDNGARVKRILSAMRELEDL